MSNKEEKIIQTIPNEINIVDRKNINLTGVKEVISATTSQVLIKTELGPIQITGSDLKITSLNEETSTVQITGELQELKYTNKKSLLQRMFK